MQKKKDANLKFVHSSKKKALFLHGPGNYHYMGDAIYNFQACCIIIMNKHHNRHVCNSNEGTKVSFMLKETIHGKSPIFSPVIKSILFFWPKYRLQYAYYHMTVIYILAQ